MIVELFISRRYFKSKPGQTIIALITMLSIIGVAIGVTALIVVIAVMAGFETDLKNRIMGIEPHLLIERREDRPMQEYESVVEVARKTAGVRAAWPLVEFQAMVRSNSRSSGALIKGVNAEAARKGLDIQGLEAIQKTRTEQPDLPPIVLGRDLARSLNVDRGDTLFIVSPQGTVAPVGFIPYMKRFIVVGFLETGMFEYDSALAFIDLEDAQALARMKGTAGAVEVRVDKVFDTPEIGRAILSRLDSDAYRLKDWMQLNKNLFSALKLEKAAMFITLTLIILVATFSITSSLVMMVIEKTKDIAVLMTLGATSRTIRRIFVLQGLLIGLIGTASGVALGTGLCWLQIRYSLIHLPGDVYYITALPVNLTALDVILVAASALFICFLATLYPAHQAARLNPVEAIRYG